MNMKFFSSHSTSNFMETKVAERLSADIVALVHSGFFLYFLHFKSMSRQKEQLPQQDLQQSIYEKNLFYKNSYSGC